MFSIKLEVVKPLLPYYEISNHLWGETADIDSDGNSLTPDSNDWNELTLILRADESQRIDIDPIDELDNGLLICSTDKYLLNKTVLFLQKLGTVKIIV